MSSNQNITTNFKDSDGVDLGSKLIRKDYLISVYPEIGSQIGIPPELWIWGDGERGELGNARTTFVNSIPSTTFAGGTDWKQISSGQYHMSAIKTDGTLWTWGYGGRLGNTITSFSSRVSTPVTTFAGGTNWKQISSGSSHTAAIKTDGTLWIWGSSGSNGLLGNAVTTNASTPVTTFAGGTNWKQVSSGNSHTTVIKTDGTLWTWGYGGQGRLGHAATTNASTPITTFAGGTDWKQVSSGKGSHTTAIKTDGTLWTWGNGTNGQLGTLENLTGIRSTPITTFAGGTNWEDVESELYTLSAGVSCTAAIKTDGTLWIWGDGLNGRLGNAITTGNISTPVTTFAGGTNWKQVSSVNAHITAIKTDGTLWAWGNGLNGRLGNASETNTSTPVTTFTGGTNWKQVSAGSQNTAAIKTDGTLWTWGSGFAGQLGNADTTNRSTPVTTFAGGTNWKQVSSGTSGSAAIKTDGTLWTWGTGNNGRLGNLVSGSSTSTPITTFAGGNNWKQVSCGSNHTAAIKTDGTLWVWGAGSSGRLGNATTTTNNSTPITTFTGGTDWKQVTAGDAHTAAIKTDGTLWAWGNGLNGRLGNATTTNVSTPVTTFAGGTNWKQVSGANDHTAALRDDGINKELFTWGNGTNGRLGNADTTDRSTPVTTFAGGTNWEDVESELYTLSAGVSCTAAIKTDGTLWIWGDGDYGKLGNAVTTYRSTPVTTFAGGSNWKQVSCGPFSHTAGIKTDGTLWTWGYSGNHSRLGNATASSFSNFRSTPITTFAGGTNWKQVSCAGYFTAAIKDDGTLWTWGNCYRGQLGNAIATAVNRSTPVTTFAGGTNWKQVSCAYRNTAAIKTDGTLWTWGNNYKGALGNRLPPVGTGISGICNTTVQLTGTSTFSPDPNSGTRITTSAGDTGTVTSIANSLLGAASLTASTTPTSGTNDDGYWTLTLPFNISYNGTSYGTIYVGTNSYVTFNAGYTVFSSLSTSNPSDQKIMISAFDRSGQRIYFGTEGTAPNRTYRVRFEGSTGTSGTLGSPTMLWEMVFYENATSQIDIQVGINNAFTANIIVSTPVTTFAGGTNWKQVSCGGYTTNNHTAAIKTDGTLWIWGSEELGALGNGVITDTIVSTPITTFVGGTDWKQVSCGGLHTAAIKTDGTLWIWGDGTRGKLGNAVTTNRSTPVTTFAGGINWKQVSAGTFDHTVALRDDGVNKELFTWGEGTGGYLGTFALKNIDTPITTFAGGTNWKQVSNGNLHTVAIKTDGTLWTWGNGLYGQLGNTTLNSAIITPITTFAGGTDWKQVSNGNLHTVAIKTDGTLWAWGRQIAGRLGNRNVSATNASTPVTTFAGGTNWKQVNSGNSNTTAIESVDF